MITKQTSCLIDFHLYHEEGVPFLLINSDSIAANECLPLPSFNFQLMEQTDKAIRQRDLKFLNNMSTLERIAGSEIFRINPLKGNWRSDEDEILISQCENKDFFQLMRTDDMPDWDATFRISDFDFLGPASFHEGVDRSKVEPIFHYSTTLYSAENPPRQMDLSMGFSLTKSAILASISKRTFRSQNSAKSYLSLNNGRVNQDCKLALSFTVREKSMSLTLSDNTDSCLPYVITGDLKITPTDVEVFEDMVTQDILNPTTGDSASKSAK